MKINTSMDLTIRPRDCDYPWPNQFHIGCWVQWFSRRVPIYEFDYEIALEIAELLVKKYDTDSWPLSAAEIIAKKVYYPS